jgi:hypothetical protein
MAEQPGNKAVQAESLALALASGLNVRDAAAKAGITDRTARKWKKRPAFARRVEELHADLVKQTVAKLSNLGVYAVAKLHDLISRDGVKEQVQLGGAKAVLEYLFRGHDLMSLEARLEAIEAALEERKRS